MSLAAISTTPGSAAPEPSAGIAADQRNGSPQHLSSVNAAKILMENGKIEAAEKILTFLEAHNDYDSEVEFLLGLIAVQERDWGGAIRRFRLILDREPDNPRVRLELARACFLKGDYTDAERQFRLARAGDLPPGVMTNIDGYLNAIQKLRTWEGSLSIAVVPDTDINAGPNIATVGLYGLPFRLSQDARERSGIGLSSDMGGEWSPTYSDWLKPRIGGEFVGTVYPNDSKANNMTIAAYAGPRFTDGAWEFSSLATGFERWYGSRFYNQGVGGSLQAIYYALPTFNINGALTVQTITYGPPAGQSGLAFTETLGAAYTIDSSSDIGGDVSLTRQDAELPSYAYISGQMQLAYEHDLADGWSVSPQMHLAFVRFDGTLAAFGVARRDAFWDGSVSILNRRIDLYGFTPQLTYIYSVNSSDIPLYGYTRNQIEVGFTRAF